MTQVFNFWQLLAGLGLFLYGMVSLESSLKVLGGRTFKLFIRKHTSNPLKGIFSGTVVTAILQSSSLVSLMILAFVGAGVISMKNAIGVILGANLGTTLTGWIFTLLGFKLKINTIAYGCIGLGALISTIFPDKKRLNNIAKAAFGFGLLFTGLDFMKSAIEGVSTLVDLSLIKQQATLIFFGVGFILTAIIQSSSALMVIALSALNAGMISFHQGAAVVIGSNLGTTLTVFFGTLEGSSDKKRVALCHFLFNFITVLLAMALLDPLATIIIKYGPVDALLNLVTFHTAFNVMGILIFLPFISLFAKFLEGLFQTPEPNITRYIHNIRPPYGQPAVEALLKEAEFLLLRVLHLNAKGLGLAMQGDSYGIKKDLSFLKNYQSVKELEGDILDFHLRTHSEERSDSELIILQSIMNAIRYAISSAKSIKDILHNIEEFVDSANDDIYRLLLQARQLTSLIYPEFKELISSEDPKNFYEKLAELNALNKEHNNTLSSTIHQMLSKRQIGEIEASTLLNFVREIYTSNKDILKSCNILFGLNSSGELLQSPSSQISESSL